MWLFDPDPAKGREIGKKIRPALIISCDALNEGPSGLTIIVPLTSQDKKIFSHVKIEPPEGGLPHLSFAVCEQIRSITKERLIKKIGKIKNPLILKQVHSWIMDIVWLGLNPL
ncbi:MAG: type II toxin-antitoxin system PemK/MazF family toxin [Pseudanabaena sp. M57BS1SP1A06MG]|nr:type II toxin-antitoxin system PemK/MazF family toxin [Pseudanabaena sp. M57BS1SP1A06MG]